MSFVNYRANSNVEGKSDLSNFNTLLNILQYVLQPKSVVDYVVK